MKKIFIVFAGMVLAYALGAEKSKLTIKNVFGGDFDALGDYDLFSRTNETDIKGNTEGSTNFALGDRLQADFENKLVIARLRLEMLYQNVANESHKFVLAPSGFVHVAPIPQVGVVVGNNFYKHFAIPSGYLAASDDTTKYGRLLVNSTSHDTYLGSDDFSVYGNGIAGGITSNWRFGEYDHIYVKAAAGTSFYTNFDDDTDMNIDFGVNGGIDNVVDLGFSAHGVNSDERKFGVFAGLTSVQNLILNAGFYYNFTDSDYLPEARVERNNVDEFKKQSTKYALGLSGGYKFANGFGVYGDVITGLTNEYIGKVKYYDSDGNLIETKIKTIVRGGSAVKYVNGVAKRTDEFTHEGVPFYTQLRLTYDMTDSVELLFNFKVRAMLRDSSSTWLTFYPHCTVELPQKLGTVAAGLRFDVNKARTDGLYSFSVPLTYTYKFKKKF